MLLSAAFVAIAFGGGGVPALVGSVAIGGSAFVGGLVLAALGKMVESLDRIAKATERQSAAWEEMRVQPPVERT